MRTYRFFIDKPTLSVGDRLIIEPPLSHHMVTVLKLKEQQSVKLFNGTGVTFLGDILNITRRTVMVEVLKAYEESRESPLRIHLIQSISKGDRMDFTLQKSVELGVTEITPVFSERSEVRLRGERVETKMAHWRKVMISACEQSGRNHIPTLHTPVYFLDWIKNNPVQLGIIADPKATQTIHDLKIPQQVSLMIGPEGGFSLGEIDAAVQHQFVSIKMGPRILRTETAAMVIITALQFQAGDL